jgi:hypothetical protein
VALVMLKCGEDEGCLESAGVWLLGTVSMLQPELLFPFFCFPHGPLYQHCRVQPGSEGHPEEVALKAGGHGAFRMKHTLFWAATD